MRTSSFLIRFDVEMTPGCSNDYLQIKEYSSERNSWTNSGNRMCGREIPQIVNTTSDLIQIVFRSNSDINGDGFKAWAVVDAISYAITCLDFF